MERYEFEAPVTLSQMKIRAVGRSFSSPMHHPSSRTITPAEDRTRLHYPNRRHRVSNSEKASMA
jgi:hypothetical protein